MVDSMADKPPEKPEWITLTKEQLRKRNARSVAIALALGAFVILVYALMWVRGPDVMSQP
jgi:hypothetical protein